MARLTAAARRKLPASKFALPAQSAYPIDTAARARSALSRAAQNATPSEQATIKRKVKAKYPSIAVGGKK
jgi:hypothetical protein